MIVKIFNQGTSNGKAHIEYLFNEEKHLGFKPQLLKGNKFITEEITGSISNKNKYISGVIAFRENEVLEKKQLLDIIDSFELTMAPFQEKGRVNFLWVLHKDKGNTELHFMSPRIELQSKKAIDIHPNTKTNLLLYEHFTRSTNFKYGFEQVDKKPFFKSNFNFSIKLVKDLTIKRAIFFQSKYCKEKISIYNKNTTKTKKAKNGMETNNRGKDANNLHDNRTNPKNAITTTRNIESIVKREEFRKSDTDSHKQIKSTSSKQYIEPKKQTQSKSDNRSSTTKAQNLASSPLVFQLQEITALYNSEHDTFKRMDLYNRLLAIRYQLEIEENAKKLQEENSKKIKP